MDNSDVSIQTLYEENKAGASYTELGRKYGFTRGKIAGLLKRHKDGLGKAEEDKYNFKQDGDNIYIVCSSKRIVTQEEIIAHFKIDLSLWEPGPLVIKTSEGYRKDRKVHWDVRTDENGKQIVNGHVEDSGKMLVVPLYHTSMVLNRKKAVIAARSEIELMIDEAKQFAPAYKKIDYPALPDGLLYEIDMQDIHFGRYTWAEESGEDYDLFLARKAVQSTLSKLLSRVQGQQIERILIPLGNDFFNVDNKYNTTTAGTPQQEAARWQQTFRAGRELCIWMIDACSQIAPVDLLIIPGNHDEQRSFYLGDSLECWYHASENVKIDNSAMKRKFYPFGKCLIGFTHGYHEKLSSLPLLMALEQPRMWGESEYREWHTGDKHNHKEFEAKADEGTGVIVRIIRSLAAHDAWTFDHGYKSLRASEGFLWSKSEGLVGQVQAIPDL